MYKHCGAKGQKWSWINNSHTIVYGVFVTHVQRININNSHTIFYGVFVTHMQRINMTSFFLSFLTRKIWPLYWTRKKMLAQFQCGIGWLHGHLLGVLYYFGLLFTAFNCLYKTHNSPNYRHRFVVLIGWFSVIFDRKFIYLFYPFFFNLFLSFSLTWNKLRSWRVSLTCESLA